MMPVWRFGSCRCCGRGPVQTTFVTGYADGKIYTGWICAECLSALRKIRQELRNRGESESQERTPRK